MKVMIHENDLEFLEYTHGRKWISSRAFQIPFNEDPSFQRVLDRKNWRRYSRERTVQRLVTKRAVQVTNTVRPVTNRKFVATHTMCRSRRRRTRQVSSTPTATRTCSGLNIRRTSVITTSYFYFGLVLGCTDADLRK